MAKSEPMEPKQKRSIEKKNHIIESGLELMMKKGYHHTTTDDIAAASGVSTGIIYRYFRDKHDILLAGLSLAFEKMYEKEFFKNIVDVADIHTFMVNILDYFLKIHIENKSMHEELETMRHSDEQVAALYAEKEIAIVKEVSHILHSQGNDKEDLFERTYMVFQLIEGYCHMCIGSTSDNINLEQMKQIAIKTSIHLLQS